MPTIRIVREFAYEVEGILKLPEWFDHEIHKYHYCECCCEIKVFKKEQNHLEDDHIWVGKIEFDDVDDVEHDLIKERCFEKK